MWQVIKECFQIVHKTANDTFVMHATMNEVEEKLKDAPFVRVHKSYFVNCRRIVSFSRSEVVLKSGEKIAVGRKLYKDTIQKYLNFISEHGDIDFIE